MDVRFLFYVQVRTIVLNVGSMQVDYLPPSVSCSTSFSSVYCHNSFQVCVSLLQVLSNERRRKRYDAFGEEEESPFQQRRPSSGERSSFQFHGSTFTFSFKSHSSSSPPDDITTRRFFENVLPDSEHAPQLIYFYNDWCPSCPKITDKWVELKDVSCLDVLWLLERWIAKLGSFTLL